MGRIRSIKPEFFKHAGLYDAEEETKLPLRLAFAGLWTCCDREGRFKWRSRELKIDILPYDDCNFSRVLDALLTRGFVVKYEVAGECFGCIPTWKEHQYINNREAHSILPEPPLNHPKIQPLDATATGDPRDDNATGTVVVKEGKGKGKEGKGKGKEGNARGKPSPDLVPEPLPEWVPKGPWDAFVEMRKDMKSPLTSGAVKLAIARLEKLRLDGHDPAEVLNQSTLKSWRGLFGVKDDERNGGNANGNGRHKESVQDVLRDLGAQGAADRQGGSPAVGNSRQAGEPATHAALGGSPDDLSW